MSFSASAGGEIQKTRPAVVISNESANGVLNRVQVVPISSSVERRYPAEADITMAGERRKAMADQLTTLGRPRLLRHLGVLDPSDLNEVVQVVRLQLGL